MRDEDRAWRRYVERFRRDGLKKIVGSGVCVAVYSGDGSDFDVKQATELGAMLLLDKPIVLLVAPGGRLPRRLAKAADAVIRDFLPDDDESQRRLMDTLRSVAGGGVEP